MPRLGLGRWLIVCALAAAPLIVVAPAADAHAFLVTTSPAAGERLPAPPDGITLRFSEPVVDGSQRLTVRSAGGRALAPGMVRLDNGGLTVVAGLPRIGHGVYVVNWSVLANDGHASAGEFAFAVGSVGALPAASSGSAQPTSWAGAAATALFLGGLVLAIGGLASEIAVWRPIRASRKLAMPPAPVRSSLAIALLGAALQLAALAGGQQAPGVGLAWDPQRWQAALSSRPGLLTGAEIVLVAYALVLLGHRALRPWALAPLGGAVVASALRGHAGVTPYWWAAPANALHLALGGLWIGALAHLVIVLRRLDRPDRRPVLAQAAGRYARMAIVLVPPLLALGAVTALAMLHRPGDLVSTPYGRVLLIKLLLVTGALILAFMARRHVLPPDGDGRRLGRLRRLTRLEASALLATVAVSAVLGSAAPPLSTAARADLLGPPPLTGAVARTAALAGQLAVYAAAAPAQLQLRVLDPGGVPARQAKVTVEARAPRGAKTLYPRSCGAGCFAMGVAWPQGTVDLTVRASARDWTGGVAAMSLDWPPGPDASAALRRVVQAMRAQPVVRLHEQVSSGPGAQGRPVDASFGGPQFVAQELYAAGATDVRQRAGPAGTIELSLYLPGSQIWYRLWVDAAHRIRREVIVDPGHQIERTLTYEPAGRGQPQR